MIVSALRGLVSLAVDAVECLLVLGAGGYARVDELWADTRTAAADRLADAEAENEVAEPLWAELSEQDVLKGRVAGLSAPETPPAVGVAPNPAAGDAPPSPSFPTAGHPTYEYFVMDGQPSSPRFDSNELGAMAWWLTQFGLRTGLTTRQGHAVRDVAWLLEHQSRTQ